MTEGVPHGGHWPGPAWLITLALLFSGVIIAGQQYGPKVIVTSDQVAAAVANSPLNPSLQQYAATIGQLAINVESGGNLGIYNGTCCTGVLQMNTAGVEKYCKCEPMQYANLPLQQQVNYWAQLTNANANNSIVRGLMQMSSFGGQPVDGAMILSCIQIGPGNCAKTLAAGTCATSAGADGNGNNFCDFAASIRGGSAASSPSNGAASGTGTATGTASGAGTAPVATVWTPVSAAAAFYNGAGVDMTAVHDAVTDFIAVAAMLWAAWVAQAQYFCYRRGSINLLTLKTNLIASTVLTMLILVITLT